MWLITPVGFFSIVQKSSDLAGDTLTVRARVRSDLEALRTQFLPELGEIHESKTNDYRFRTVAPRAAVAAAMASLATQLQYSNFKNQVAKVQGPARAHLYHGVWDVLYQLQTAPGTYEITASNPMPDNGKPIFHHQKDDNGQRVAIKKPHQPSLPSTWSDAGAVACVVPQWQMPAHVNGLPVSTWDDVPTTKDAWEALAHGTSLEEPKFTVPDGYKKAAGVVIREPDGRVWVVAPTNGFGGYQATFPKGTMEHLSARGTALKEAFEETGLQVRLVRHLVDVKRSTSYTRYFLAERVCGNPADMGWESQAVMLVPVQDLDTLLNNRNDRPLIEALRQA